VCRQRVKDEPAILRIANVNAVECENVQMDIESQSDVRSLDGSHSSRVRIGYGGESESRLRAPLERATEFADERTHDFGAQRPVIPEQRAQSPRQGADPVSNGHRRQDTLLEVNGHIGHASPAA
jgi:hypothetical protein